jgi:hypothetical protein
MVASAEFPLTAVELSAYLAGVYEDLKGPLIEREFQLILRLGRGRRDNTLFSFVLGTIL